MPKDVVAAKPGRWVRFLTGLTVGTGAGYLLRRKRGSAGSEDGRRVENTPPPPRSTAPGRHGGAVGPAGGGAGPVLGSTVRPASLQGAAADDALVLLARQHDQIREDVEWLLAFRVDGPHEAGDLRAAGQRAISAASRHEVAEEEHFWPLVRSRLPDGEALAETGRSHELELKRILQALESRRPGDIDFRDLLLELRQVVADHVAFEEGEVWPRLDTLMTEGERLELGRHLGRAEELAPTRPHPSALADPSEHRAISRAIALFDRGFDRVARRGRGPHD